MMQPGSVGHALGAATIRLRSRPFMLVGRAHGTGTPMTNNNKAVFRERIFLDKNNQTFFTTKFPSRTIR